MLKDTPSTYKKIAARLHGEHRGTENKYPPLIEGGGSPQARRDGGETFYFSIPRLL